MLYSNHARQRMNERGITKPMILAVLIHGEESEGRVEGRRCHSMEGINVVTAPKGKQEIVVTVWEDRELKYRPHKWMVLPSHSKRARRIIRQKG